MELHQLEYMIALSKHLKFSLAAEESLVSQANLSQQIKKLEDELGVSLFTRSTRSVKLTQAGEEFLLYAKRIFNEIEGAKNAMTEYTQLNKGNLRIGVIKSVIYFGLSELLSDFRNKYPGINIELYEGSSYALLKKLHSSEIDVAFISTPYCENSELEFKFYPMIYDDLVVVLPKDHHFAARKYIDITELSAETFLVLKSSVNHHIISQSFQKAGFEPSFIFSGNQIETIIELIGGGFGITLFTGQLANSISNSRTTIINLKSPIQVATGLAVPNTSSSFPSRAFQEMVTNFKFKSDPSEGIKEL
ncbi:LysR family transcriptional regulator [Bacillus sp. Marseille-P3661]|uniref:LysR family transcriptional regulator n=1 Tax=Bacillus sp. Marseille-P3661 TaxID=1936234 RepID=UPI000C81D13B|nr:LysR family transcriptional regulator [Bacillus sp. Marseille-P3661]